MVFKSSKNIIVSGIQPTGNLHIGNYLGAVKNWVDLQNSGEYEMLFFVADLHSLTGNMSAKERQERVNNLAVEMMAAGIDPDKSTLFVQSHVMGHTVLAWIFDCVTPIAELERMTQFKDKANRQEKNINAGLFTYPVLQAADILLYRGTHVPVGEDQVQHVELTRNVARWFNKRYGEYFPEAKPILTKNARVMSLLEPEKKMSKSLGEGHVIELADESKVIEKKLKKAVTATTGGGKAPGVENLLMMLNEFSDKNVYHNFIKAEKDGSIRYGDLKSEVARSISGYFADFREKRKELLADTGLITSILENGEKKAQAVADKTISDVKKMIGIGY
jgi:tryptophanyl-tRNA synthetase